jgi:hypothetical protein
MFHRNFELLAQDKLLAQYLNQKREANASPFFCSLSWASLDSLQQKFLPLLARDKLLAQVQKKRRSDFTSASALLPLLGSNQGPHD